MTPLERLTKALQSNNRDQALIAEKGLEWVVLLLKKNADYGGSAFKIPVLAPNLTATTAIEVRMSDKIERIKSLANKPAEVEESLDDTYDDLGAYCLLRKIAKEIHNEDA